jgi:hypothetical protein
MVDNVLYFPYIRVPDNAWFTRVLLYWDSVGSIVPYEYIHRPERLGSHMQSLVTEGLVKQIIPGEYTYKIPNFTDAFLELAERHMQMFHITKDSLSTLPTFRVHVEKLDDIGYRLCQMGLARQSDYPWYEIEARLANQFMAYLAGVLSSLPEVQSRPITDEQAQLDIYGSSGQYRGIILEHLLPSPSEGVTPTALSHFKSKNQAQLRKFRNEVESFILQVASVTDEHLREEMTSRFVERAKVDIDAIVEAMASQGWTKVTLGRFLSYAVAGVTLADAIATGGLLTTIAAAFGVGASAYTTYKDTKSPNGVKDSYAAYAALATRL